MSALQIPFETSTFNSKSIKMQSLFSEFHRCGYLCTARELTACDVCCLRTWDGRRRWEADRPCGGGCWVSSPDEGVQQGGMVAGRLLGLLITCLPGCKH